MAKINIDFQSILQPIKDMQAEMAKFVAQMQEASKISNGLAANLKSGVPGKARFASLEQAGSYVEAQKRVGNVYAFPQQGGIPISNMSDAHVLPAAPKNQTNIDSLSFIQAQNSAKEFSALAASRQNVIQGLSSSQDPVAKMIQSTLKDAQDQANDAIKEVQKLSAEVVDQNGKFIKENTEAQKALTEAMSKANRLQDKANSLQEEATRFLKNTGGGGGGNGPDGQGGSLRDLIGRAAARTLRAAPMISSIVGGVADVASAGFGLYNTAQERDITAGFNTLSNVSQAESIRYQRYISQAAPMSGREILRNYSDLIAPSLASRFTGTGGLQRAGAFADSMQAAELDLARNRVVQGGIGLAAQLPNITFNAIQRGILGGVTGGGPGMVAGAGGAILGGAANMARQTTDLFNNNPFLRMQGGVANMPIIGGMFGDQQGMIGRTAQEQISEMMLKREQRIRELQDQELNTAAAQRMAQGLDIRMQTQEAQLAGTSQLGGRSIFGLDVLAGRNTAGLAQRITQSQNVIQNLRSGILAPTSGSLMAMVNPSAFIGQAGKQPILGQSLVQQGVTQTEPLVQIPSAAETARTFNASIINPARDRAVQTAGNLLLGPAEAGQMANMFIAQGGRKADFTEFAKMRFGGFGTAEQLAGNLFGLQSVSGQKITLDEFKRTLAEGVSVGFSSAPLMQRFVGALTSLGENLGVTDTQKLSGQLGFMAQALGVGGIANMRSLREAERGLASLGSFTGQASGVTGMLKTVAGLGAGLTAGQGLNTVTGMNMMQLDETAKELENLQASGLSVDEYVKKNKLSPEAERLARLNRGNLTQAIRGVRASADATGAQIRGVVNLGLGKDAFATMSRQVQQLMKQDPSKFASSAEFRDIEARLTETARMRGIEPSAAVALVMRDAMETMTDKKEREQIESTIRKRKMNQLSVQEQEGINKARENKFLAAQKQLMTSLAFDAQLDIAGTASKDQVESYIKNTGMSEDEVRKRLGLKKGQPILREDLAALSAREAGANRNEVIIGEISQKALNSFATMLKDRDSYAYTQEDYKNTKAGVK